MNVQQIRDLAFRFRSLSEVPSQHPRPEQRLLIDAGAAGRLLAEAMDAGAWPLADDLREIRRETLDAEPSHGYAGLWIVARQNWLRQLNPHHEDTTGTHTPPWSFEFPNDCRIVAAALDAEAASEDAITPVEGDYFDVVTLDQIGAVVGRKGTSMRRYKGDWPDPVLPGGGGKAEHWRWCDVRPWLENKYGRKLPERYPRLRQIAH